MRRIALKLSDIEYVALAFRALHYRRSVPDQLRRELEQGTWEPQAIAQFDQRRQHDHRSAAERSAGSLHLFVETRSESSALGLNTGPEQRPAPD
jgi:hypothetical protein